MDDWFTSNQIEHTNAQIFSAFNSVPEREIFGTSCAVLGTIYLEFLVEREEERFSGSVEVIAHSQRAVYQSTKYLRQRHY